jgi:hypothetical protein
MHRNIEHFVVNIVKFIYITTEEKFFHKFSFDKILNNIRYYACFMKHDFLKVLQRRC